MLSPKRLKFRKQHKGRIHGMAKGGSELSFGSYGLKALTPDRITARQIEAARRAGMAAVALATTFTRDQIPDYDILVDDFTQLSYEQIMQLPKKRD